MDSFRKWDIHNFIILTPMGGRCCSKGKMCATHTDLRCKVSSKFKDWVEIKMLPLGGRVNQIIITQDKLIPTISFHVISVAILVGCQQFTFILSCFSAVFLPFLLGWIFLLNNSSRALELFFPWSPISSGDFKI